MTPDDQRLLEELKRELGLVMFRVDKHGEKINDHEVRMRVVEDERRDLAVLKERVSNLVDEVSEGFAAQGDEIKSLRRAVVAAAISIAGSALLLALTLIPH